MMKNKKILLGAGIGILAVVMVVVLIGGCIEEKPIPKEEL